MPEANRIEDDLASRELARLVSNQDKAKAAIEWADAENLKEWGNFIVIDAFELLRPLAAGTHVMVNAEYLNGLLKAVENGKHKVPTSKEWDAVIHHHSYLAASQEQE